MDAQNNLFLDKQASLFWIIIVWVREYGIVVSREYGLSAIGGIAKYLEYLFVEREVRYTSVSLNV